MAAPVKMCQDSTLDLLILIRCGGLVADNKPKFSAGMVTGIITLFWLVVFGFAVYHGSQGFIH